MSCSSEHKETEGKLASETGVQGGGGAGANQPQPRCPACGQFMSPDGSKPHQCDAEGIMAKQNLMDYLMDTYGIVLEGGLTFVGVREALLKKHGEEALEDVAQMYARVRGESLSLPSLPVKLERKPYQGPELGSPEYERRALGVLFGEAAGDALGYDVEFTSPSGIYSRYGLAGITHPNRTGGQGVYLFTDDTQMALALARGLTDDVFNIEDYEPVVREYVAWMNSPENNRAPGGACMAGCRNLSYRDPWYRSGQPDSKGAGSLMRVFPVGVVFRDNPDLLARVAADQAVMTHCHPTGCSSAIGGAYFVSQLLKDVSPLEALDNTIKYLEGYTNTRETRSALEAVKTVLDKDEYEASKVLGSGWVGEEALAIGVWCFLKSPDDLHRVTRRAANFPGKGGSCDRDTVGAVAGAIAGAWVGMDGVLPDWQERTEHRDELERLGKLMNEKALAYKDMPAPEGKSYGIRIMERRYVPRGKFY